jgi:uridine kinase
MTSSVPPALKYKIYIETLSQLKDVSGEFTRWTDVRLLRRMVRDHAQRAYDPRQTLQHWHYVRRSELKHIIPFLGTVDYIINGALAYELPVHKKHLFHYFPGFVEEFANSPKQQDAYIRANRVYELLKTIEMVEDTSCIPANSLLREFIGGSTYEY